MTTSTLSAIIDDVFENRFNNTVVYSLWINQMQLPQFVWATRHLCANITDLTSRLIYRFFNFLLGLGYTEKKNLVKQSWQPLMFSRVKLWNGVLAKTNWCKARMGSSLASGWRYQCLKKHINVLGKNINMIILPASYLWLYLSAFDVLFLVGFFWRSIH